MVHLRSKAELAEWLEGAAGRPRFLVPTMGALHEGHASLFDLARREAGGEGEVMATIFVNPAQFGPEEDYDRYPRRLDADLQVCRSRRVDAVFAPSAEEMYQADSSILVRETSLSASLCGARRPGHFDGVCTVVAKLFNLARPEAAVFGEKDYQQLAVVRRLVRDLDFPVRVLAGATVREEDGLALSSRNAYLSAGERAQAPVIFQTLCAAAAAVASGEAPTPGDAAALLREGISAAPLARLDYAEVVDADTLEPLLSFAEGSPRLLAAVTFGTTRLIDNLAASPPGAA